MKRGIRGRGGTNKSARGEVESTFVWGCAPYCCCHWLGEGLRFVVKREGFGRTHDEIVVAKRVRVSLSV